MSVLALALAGFGLGGCATSVCPTNQASVTPEGTKAPSRSAGTYDKNGRFKKKNAYHPSARQVGN